MIAASTDRDASCISSTEFVCSVAAKLTFANFKNKLTEIISQILQILTFYIFTAVKIHVVVFRLTTP
jgi:hypothetical protein